MKNSELQIASYILRPDIIIRDLNDPKLPDYFIDAENIEELVRIKNKLDADYVDGYISIIYKNRSIMGPRHWDLVTPLWAYILNMIEEVQVNKYAKTYFPDQPLEFTFTLFGPEVLVTLDEQKHLLPKEVFFESLLDGAYAFFHTYAFLFGPAGGSVQYEFNQIAELREKLMLNNPANYLTK